MQVVEKSGMHSLIECIKNGDVGGVFQYIKNLNLDFLAITIFFGVGILTGFLCKRYLKKIIILCLISLGTVIAFEYAGLLAVRWDFIQSVIGATPEQVFETVRFGTIVWAQNNTSAAVSLIVGFLIGVKVG